LTGPILVLGAGGQLGTEILDQGRQSEIDVVGLSRREADISDRQSIASALERIRPRLVVNAAAYTAVDKAETDIEAAFEGNARGPQILAEETDKVGVPLLHFSTDYVFDGIKIGAYLEDDPIGPVGVYGRSKAEGEAKVRGAAARHVIIRTSWVYGIYGANFLKTMLRLAQERDELRVVADQGGCPTATIDLARAAFAVDRCVSEGAAPWGTYHFAGNGATTWFDFASEIVDAAAPLLKRRPKTTPIATSDYPTPARRPVNSELDSSRFELTFGYRSEAWQTRTRQLVGFLLRDIA
jgi:dTDP-4-dehydrorhamnose reductase